MVPNDILAILAVAVTIGVVVASEGARGSTRECYYTAYTPCSPCVHALQKAAKAGPAPRVNLVYNYVENI